MPFSNLVHSYLEHSLWNCLQVHDDVFKWKHFPRYWPFVRGIHRSTVNSPHKGQWRGALMFSSVHPMIIRLSKQSWGWRFETLSRSLWLMMRSTLVQVMAGLRLAIGHYWNQCCISSIKSYAKLIIGGSMHRYTYLQLLTGSTTMKLTFTPIGKHTSSGQKESSHRVQHQIRNVLNVGAICWDACHKMVVNFILPLDYITGHISDLNFDRYVLVNITMAS